MVQEPLGDLHGRLQALGGERITTCSRGQTRMPKLGPPRESSRSVPQPPWLLDEAPREERREGWGPRLSSHQPRLHLFRALGPF